MPSLHCSALVIQQLLLCYLFIYLFLEGPGSPSRWFSLHTNITDRHGRGGIMERINTEDLTKMFKNLLLRSFAKAYTNTYIKRTEMELSHNGIKMALLDIIS